MFSNVLYVSVEFITRWYIIGLVLNLISIISCPIIASNKGRSIGGWIVGGLFLSTLGLIIISCLPSLYQRRTYKPTYQKFPTLNNSTGNKTPTHKWKCDNCGEMIASDPCPYCGFRKS